MKNLTKVISVSILIFCSPILNAQPEAAPELDYANSILEMVITLRKNIDNFFEEQKASQLSRKLGYLKNDLQDYLDIRESFFNELEAQDFESSDNTTLRLSQLTDKIYQLDDRLIEIRDYFTSSLSDDESEDLVYHIYPFFSQQMEYLSEVDSYLQGNTSISKSKLRTERNRLHRSLSKSIKKIRRIQEILNSKF